jgi:hypothetical protein
MKTLIKVLILTAILFAISGCGPDGTTYYDLNGSENALPDELKGLKVYSVKVGALDYVKVAILNGEVNSATYSEGKTTETTIIVNGGKRNERIIYASQIISENDSIIVLKK